MEKPPASKRRRRTAAGPAAAASASISLAVSRTAITSRRTTRSQKPLLSTELLARVASYASLGPDLLSLCIVAGPKDCAVIRHAYLRRNQNYLLHFLHGCVVGSVDIQLACDRYRTWMEVNSDWRTAVVSDWRIDNLNKVTIPDADGVMVTPFHPFNNPALAIELGLTEVLEHLVEEKGIDVNAYRWNSYGACTNSMGRTRTYNLLSYCIDSSNLEAFRYLLGRKGIEIHSLRCVGGGDFTIIDLVFRQPKATAFFRELVRHPSFDVNRSFSLETSHAVSPLHLVIGYLMVDSNAAWFDLPTWKANFQLLLEVGADPYMETERHGDALQYAKAELANCPGHEGLKGAIEILEDWVAIK